MAIDLTLLEPGHSLGRSGEALEVRREGRTLESVPLHRLLSVTVGPGVSISSDLLAALTDRGVILQVQDHGERPAAVLLSPHGWGGAALRRSQARAGEDGRSLVIARALVRAKLLHQARLQQLWGTYVPQEGLRERFRILAQELQVLSAQAQDPEGVQGLLALEGNGARIHWSGLALMVPFQQRRYPRAPDLSNQLLNYGYGVLARKWLNIVLRSGLDPHMGFLHADRVGRPSLVLDLMEPWRPWVDRTIVGLLRKGVPLGAEQGDLTLATRRRVLNALHQAFQSIPPRHSQSLGSIWQSSTRQLARHLHTGSSWKPPLFHP